MLGRQLFVPFTIPLQAARQDMTSNASLRGQDRRQELEMRHPIANMKQPLDGHINHLVSLRTDLCVTYKVINELPCLKVASRVVMNDRDLPCLRVRKLS